MSTHHKPIGRGAGAALVLILFLYAGLSLPGCKEESGSRRTEPEKNETMARAGQTKPATDLRIPGRSVPLGRLTKIDEKVLSVAGLRRHLSDKRPLHFAGVLIQTPKKALDCLAKQAQHHESCPPPYFTFGDTEPYEGLLPKRLGARVLVMMNPQVPVETHHTYVVLGSWCPDRNLARFCAQALWRVPDKEGVRFWHEVAEPLLPKRR